MTEILLYLATNCGFLFHPSGFRFVGSAVSEGFGDAEVVLESDAVRLRFVRDRGQLLLWFQPISWDPNDWFSLGPLRGVLFGDRGGSEVLDAASAAFLAEAIGELEARFAERTTRDATVEALREQERLRAQERFG